MGRLGQVVFGKARFSEGQELLEFRYKFLIVLQLFGAVATGLLLATGNTAEAPIPPAHLRAMTLYTLTCTVLWLALRGHPDRFKPIAWVLLLASIAELASAVIHVPSDEMRIIWLFLNIPAVYLLLGRGPGAAVTGLYVVGLLAGNAHLAAPYSPNAVATAVVAFIYSGAFFDAYSRQLFTQYRRLREMALLDTLTGVMNARAFYALCDRLIAADRREGRPYAVLFVDLDHFKSINDRWGHAAGDTVLKAVADCLARALRRSDALGRIGGEEFCVFLPATDLAGAMQLAESLRRSIEALMPQVGEQPLRVTASIGVAESHPGRASLREIQQAADQAMYQAKAAGRNRVTAFEEAAV